MKAKEVAKTLQFIRSQHEREINKTIAMCEHDWGTHIDTDGIRVWTCWACNRVTAADPTKKARKK